MRKAIERPRREHMLVLLDATASPHRNTLIDAYVDAVVHGLGDVLVVACRPESAAHFRSLAPDAVIEVGPAALRWRLWRMLWRQLVVPYLARRHDVDAVHSPMPPVPLLMARPRVVSVQTMECFDGASVTRPHIALQRLALRAAVRVSDEVVAVNRDVAGEVASTLGFPAADILVPPQASDIERFAAAHRVAYRSAASLVPAATGPIILPPVDGHPSEPGAEPT